MDANHSGRITGLTNAVACGAGFDKSGGFDATPLGAYGIRNARLSSPKKVTPRPLGTIMRSPGEFQGAFIMEAIIEQVARKLGVDPTAIQNSNMLSDTYNAGVRKIWGDLKGTYDEVHKSVDAFNAANRWVKQGVYMMPLQYIQGKAVGFQGNQETAIVAVHSDGTVAIDSTGIEMGQGNNTKAEQTAAMVFEQLAADFQLDLVSTVVPKSTSRLNFSGISPTWGSGTSESVAAAVQKDSWKAIVKKATAAGASLTRRACAMPARASRATRSPVPPWPSCRSTCTRARSRSCARRSCRIAASP